MPPKLQLAGSLPLVALLGAVTAFEALAIDMYLPAFSRIAATMNVDAGAVQASLSVFLIGLAAGQAFFGPLTDRFGRRPPLMAGIALLAAASVLVALAGDMVTFTIGRALQGIGGAACIVIPRILVADLYEPRASAKVFSLLTQIMMIAPVAAPPLGGLLLGWADWRPIFWLLAALAAASLIPAWRMVPETVPAGGRRTGSVGAALREFGRLFRRRGFLAHAASGSFSVAGLFAYIGASAFVFVEHYRLSPDAFGLVFALNALGMIGAGQLNILLLDRWGESLLLRAGLLVHAALVLLMVLAVATGRDDVWLIGPLLFLAVATFIPILGNVTACVMDFASDATASAASLFGVMQYALAGAVGALLGAAHDGTLLPPLAVMLACAVLALAAHAVAARQDPRTVPAE